MSRQLLQDYNMNLEDILPPLPPKDATYGEKRAAYCKRYTARKQIDMQRMREEAAKLNDVLEQLKKKASQSSSTIASNMPTAVALQNLNNEVDKAFAINQWLHKQLEAYKKAGQKMNIFDAPAHTAPWLLKEGFPFELKTPITKEECNNFVVKQDTNFLEFLLTNSFPHGTTTLGWHNKSMQYSNSEVYFNFKKSYENRSAREDARTVFALNTDPDCMTKHPGIPSSYHARFAKVQEIDENNIVMCSEVFDEYGNIIRQSAYIVHLYEDECHKEGYSIYFTRLEPSRFKGLDDVSCTHNWNGNRRNHQEWTFFSDEINGCSITYCAKQKIPQHHPADKVLQGGFALVLQTECWAFEPPLHLEWE